MGTDKSAEGARLAVGLPAKGKLSANISALRAEDRARMGITDEQANAAVEAARPTGVQVVRSPWKESEDHEMVTQVRVIDYDINRVLFSGTEEQYAAFLRAAKGG